MVRVKVAILVRDASFKVTATGCLSVAAMDSGNSIRMAMDVEKLTLLFLWISKSMGIECMDIKN